MKIAIPAEGRELTSLVNQSFGRTAYFVIIDSDSMEYEVLDNQAAQAQGGAGIKAAEAIAATGASVVITYRLGQNAADVLKAAGIKILRAVPGTIQEMVEKYNNAELSELTEIHAGHFGGM